MIGLSKRQTEIIEASVSLISQFGIQNLTMRNLAEKLSITEPALYRHYKNKSEILSTIFEIFKQESTKSLLEIEASKISSLQKLKNIFISRCNFFRDNPDYSSIMFSEELFKNDIEISKKFSLLMKFHQEKLLKIVKSGQNEKEINQEIPADHVCTIFLGSLRLLVTKWRMSEYKFNLADTGLEHYESIKTLIKHSKVS